MLSGAVVMFLFLVFSWGRAGGEQEKPWSFQEFVRCSKDHVTMETWYQSVTATATSLKPATAAAGLVGCRAQPIITTTLEVRGVEELLNRVCANPVAAHLPPILSSSILWCFSACAQELKSWLAVRQ